MNKRLCEIESMLKEKGGIIPDKFQELASIPEDVPLPATTIVELKIVNSLLENEENYQIVFKLTNRLMPHVLLNEIASFVSRTRKGKNKTSEEKKFSFDSMQNLKKVVIGVVQSHTKSSTLQEIDHKLGDWFKAWEDRDGARLKRLVKKSTTGTCRSTTTSSDEA